MLACRVHEAYCYRQSKLGSGRAIVLAEVYMLRLEADLRASKLSANTLSP
jgi:hypothetical protein